MDVSHIFGYNRGMSVSDFAGVCRSLALHLEHVSTPWRPAIAKTLNRRVLSGSTYSPVDLSSVDLEMEARGVLTDILGPVLRLLGDDAPPRPTEPTGRCVADWVATHAEVIYPWLDDDDVAAIEALHRQLLHHHGYTSPDETRRAIVQVSVAAGVRAGYMAPLKETAELASVAGYGSIAERTIRRWADADHVHREYLDDGSVTYNLDDVLTLLSQRRDDLNDKEHLMTADRDIVTVYGRANCVACRATTNRLDKYGIDYHYIDVDTIEYTDHLRVLATRAGGTALPIVVVDHPERPRTVWSGLNVEKINELATITSNDNDNGVADAA